jgi:dTDP-4-amino-4,6-dideoxygalactose transaminase
MSNFGFAAGRAMVVGTNAKLSEYAAAVGLAQLERWPRLRALRGALWDRYWPLLRAVDGVVLQRGFAASPPAVLALATPMDGAACVAALAAAGIEARRWYCPPLHRHPAFTHLEHAGAGAAPGLPVAEALGAHVVGPPFHNFLSPEDLERISGTLRRVLAPSAPARSGVCGASAR